MPALVLIHRMALALGQLHASWRRELDLAPNALRALLHLTTHGPATAADLARRLGITSASMVALVDRLARTGFLERVPDARDRRRVLLYPTKRAVSAHAMLGDDLGSELESLLAGLEPAARHAVVEFLERATEVLDAHASPSTTSAPSPGRAPAGRGEVTHRPAPASTRRAAASPRRR